jgi:hypothetical protein
MVALNNHILFLFVDFSYSKWLTDNSIVNTGTLEKALVQQLLRNLNVDKFMKTPHCDRHRPPYTPKNQQGWNLDSKLHNFYCIF